MTPAPEGVHGISGYIANFQGAGGYDGAAGVCDHVQVYLLLFENQLFVFVL